MIEGRSDPNGAAGTDSVGAECRFGADRLSRIARMEHWHFWFAGRRAVVDRLLERHLEGSGRLILDIGCGTGSNLEALERRGHRVVGLDLRPEGLRAARRARPGSRLVRADAVRAPLAEGRFDAVLLLDVLEHVDDRILLGEVRRLLRPGGLAVITVPAAPWLWSRRDEEAGHLRRYTRRRFARAIKEASLEVREIVYYQCLLFPLVALMRLAGRVGPGVQDVEECPPRFLNTIMAGITGAEVRMGSLIQWPWGSTLAAACRKG